MIGVTQLFKSTDVNIVTYAAGILSNLNTELAVGTLYHQTSRHQEHASLRENKTINRLLQWSIYSSEHSRTQEVSNFI